MAEKTTNDDYEEKNFQHTNQSSFLHCSLPGLSWSERVRKQPRKGDGFFWNEHSNKFSNLITDC